MGSTQTIDCSQTYHGAFYLRLLTHNDFSSVFRGKGRETHHMAPSAPLVLAGTISEHPRDTGPTVNIMARNIHPRKLGPLA